MTVDSQQMRDEILFFRSVRGYIPGGQTVRDMPEGE
jgi:hypothetical protein